MIQHRIGEFEMEQLRSKDEPITSGDIEALDAPLDSPALTRLLDEVRDEGLQVSRSYNRTYNRHNR
jgi:hypothetical protein